MSNTITTARDSAGDNPVEVAASKLPTTGRSVAEWIGATPDTPIPDRVKLRVFRRHEGVCHLSGRKIRGGELWDCDHVKALTNGGENRESNLAPALRDKHRKKTAEDVAERAEIDTKSKKHLGIKPQRRGFTAWRKFDGTIVRRDA